MVADQGRSRLVVASVATLVLLVIAFVSASSSPLLGPLPSSIDIDLDFASSPHEFPVIFGGDLDEAVQLIRVNVTSGHLELTGEGRRLLEGLSQPLHVLAGTPPFGFP